MTIVFAVLVSLLAGFILGIIYGDVVRAFAVKEIAEMKSRIHALEQKL
jgi:hypothetical protein